FFFFFQAEDGIRDKLVTGVQTCALPISVRTLFSVPTSRSQRCSTSCATRRGTTTTPSRSPTTMSPRLTRTPPTVRGWPQSVTRRSEERRVGKECGGRGEEDA